LNNLNFYKNLKDQKFDDYFEGNLLLIQKPKVIAILKYSRPLTKFSKAIKISRNWQRLLPRDSMTNQQTNNHKTWIRIAFSGIGKNLFT
jgi:hypothetical protein